MKQITRLDKWVMQAAGKTAPCTLPCSLFTVFYENGWLPDPYKDDNEIAYFALSREDCTFESTFDFAPEPNKRYVFRAEKLDTFAEIYLNGVLIGKADNAFRPFSFDVPSDLLKHGKNTALLKFTSATTTAEKKYERFPVQSDMETPKTGFFGRATIRKPQYMFGWDWGACLPDTGIYGEVAIGEKRDEFDDLRITQSHENGKVTLTVKSGLPCTATLYSPLGKRHAVTQTVNGYCNIVVENPELWWPNNLGAQPLYTLICESADGETVERKIGLRTITVSQKPDAYGREFCFVVNGKKIFVCGANYIPEDHIVTRISRTRTYDLIKKCKDANFNMLRVWGGGDYASEDLLDACDEMGIIVWQDCTFACQHVYLSEDFKRSVTEEVTANLKRMAHRASLGLICGNNEMEGSIGDRAENTYPQYPYIYQRPWLDAMDYMALFEHTLPDLVAKYAPDTFYWSCSPSSGGGFYRTFDENFGDTHEWSVWDKDDTLQRIKACFPRFASEFGVCSYPCTETLRAFSDAEICTLTSEAVRAHYKKLVYHPDSQIQSDRLAEQLLGKADGIDAQIERSQRYQGELMRAYIEHLRINRGRCMGALYWQVNDAWPTVSWSTIDYYGREKLSHAEIKRVFAPLLAAAEEQDGVLRLYVCNDTLQDFTGSFSAEIDGKHWSGVVNVAALSVGKVGDIPIEKAASLTYTVSDKDGNIVSTCRKRMRK